MGATALSLARRLYLGDEPGLGKTRTVLHAAETAGVSALHVLCPAVVREHWKREHAALGYSYALRVESYQRYVVSEKARQELQWHAGNVALALDEAHFLKHSSSRRTRLILGTGTGLAHGYHYVWPLSGTPVPRNPAEIFPIMLALWPERLKAAGVSTYMSFLNRFCQWRATTYGPRIYGLRNAEELRALIKPVMFRRLVKDVLPDLPPLRWGVVTISAAPTALEEVYRLEQLPSIARLHRQLNLVGQLPPADENIARYRHAVGDAKAPAAAELIASELEAEPGSKRVVFAYHRSVLDTLQAALEKYNVVRVDGDVPQSKRAGLVEYFAHGAARVFLGQLQACATGLDGLQYGSHDAVLVEPDWATDVNVQAGRRVTRIGSTLPGLARMLALAGTLDEAIVKNHYREVQMVQQALEEEES